MSGTQIFAYRQLILLQLPLHLLVSILTRKNTGSSPLTLITCGLALHSWLFIEIQFNGEFAFVKSDKIVNPMKNIFLTNLNIFIYIMLCFLIKYLWMSLKSSTSITL